MKLLPADTTRLGLNTSATRAREAAASSCPGVVNGGVLWPPQSDSAAKTSWCTTDCTPSAARGSSSAASTASPLMLGNWAAHRPKARPTTPPQAHGSGSGSPGRCPARHCRWRARRRVTRRRVVARCNAQRGGPRGPLTLARAPPPRPRTRSDPAVTRRRPGDPGFSIILRLGLCRLKQLSEVLWRALRPGLVPQGAACYCTPLLQLQPSCLAWRRARSRRRSRPPPCVREAGTFAPKH